MRLLAKLAIASAGALALLVSTGCKPVPTTTGMFVVPTSLDELSEEHFFDQPWPSDLRLENGFVRLKGFPDPKKGDDPNVADILGEYIDAMAGVLDGFSPAATGYLRFTGPLDPASLPATPADARLDTSTVQLIDVDQSSPEYGQRKLISLEWRPDAGVYWQANTLAFMPTFGFPLRARTRYALVVTTDAKAADGTNIGPSADLRQVLGLDPPAGAAANARYRTELALNELEAIGILEDQIAQLAVFTTADPTAETFAIADATKKSFPAPTADPAKWQLLMEKTSSEEYVGEYGPSPNYQHGKIPFAEFGDGGNFVFQDGKPVVADTFSLRFSLLVPKEKHCPMPPNGYPIVLYAHGTGGDYRSYVGDGTGSKLVTKCVATMGVDQIFHGTRPGAPPDGNERTIELLFFNVQNIVAARTNARQSAIDEVQRARLFTESHMSVPGSVSKSGKEIKLDASRLMFFGHSQGGLNGPLYLAADDSARGGVLSGSSSTIMITLLEKTQPAPSIKGLVDSLLFRLRPDEEDEVDFFHPGLSLAQTIVDVVDPLHYARFSILEPREGFAPKSVYMTEGINPDGTGDSYAPPHGIEAHAIAMGLPLQLPNQRPIVESQFGGPQPVEIPPDGLSGNLDSGDASGVLAQWAVPDGTDGHFVVFDVPAAREQAAQFCRNLADDRKGRVPSP